MLQTWKSTTSQTKFLQTLKCSQEIKEFNREPLDPTNRYALGIHSVILEPSLSFGPFLPFPDGFIRLHS